jgi:hypothetical protein
MSGDDAADRAAAAIEVVRDVRRQCDNLFVALLAQSLERGVAPRVLDVIDPSEG